MMNGVVPYAGGGARVIAYDTFANNGTFAFGVLLSYEEAKEHELNRRALAVAREFMLAVNSDPAWIKITGCSFCHIDDLASFPGQLWHLPAFRAWILPKEGCPKPPQAG